MANNAGFLPIALPALKTSRRKLPPREQRVRFNNVELPLRLPNVNISTECDVHLLSALFTNRQICKKICEWFSGWRPWQKQILLCIATEKCTQSQLQVLVTTLEPVFHRDFIAKLKGIYPTNYLNSRFIHTLPSVLDAQEMRAFLASQEAKKHENTEQVEDQLPDILAELNPEVVTNSESPESRGDFPEVLDDNRDEKLTTGTISDDPEGLIQDECPQTAAEIEEQEINQHRHAPTFCRNVSTPNFFSLSNVDKLGPLKTAARPGVKQRLYGHVPNTFKQAKWWEREKGKRFLKPRRSKLSNHFRAQLNQIHTWFNEWQPHERVEILSEVVKCCDPESLKYFAQCLSQRLRNETGLNCVPDQTLLQVFSYLDVRDLCASSQVCQRWRFLAQESSLWKNRIDTLGNKEGVGDLTKKIEALGGGQHVDWKQAYREVRGFYKELRDVQLEEKQKLDAKKKAAKQRPKCRIQTDSPSFKEEELKKRMLSAVHELPVTRSMIDAGPAQSPATVYLQDGMEEFETRHDDQNDLTGGNLKMLAWGLQALTRDESKVEDEDVALDVRPMLMQASNLLADRSSHQKFRYLSLAVYGVLAIKRVRRLQGHMDAVLCLQFDKRRLFTGSADRNIRVWDVRSGRSIRKMKGHKGGVRCIQFDDEKVISGSWDMTIMVWHIVKFTRIRVLYGHTGCVSCLKFDKRYLISGSHDRSIRIWSLSTWKCIREIPAHDGVVNCLEFDGQFIVSGSSDRTIKLWSLDTGECLRVFKDNRDAVLSLKILGGLAISGSEDGTISFWDLAEGVCEAAIQGHEGPVHSIAFNGHEHFFTAGGDHLVKEWDVGTCTCLRSLQGHRGPVLGIQAVVNRIVSCSGDGFVRIWDLETAADATQSRTIAVDDNVIQPATMKEAT